MDPFLGDSLINMMQNKDTPIPSVVDFQGKMLKVRTLVRLAVSALRLEK